MKYRGSISLRKPTFRSTSCNWCEGTIDGDDYCLVVERFCFCIHDAIKIKERIDAILKGESVHLESPSENIEIHHPLLEKCFVCGGMIVKDDCLRMKHPPNKKTLTMDEEIPDVFIHIDCCNQISNVIDEAMSEKADELLPQTI